MRGPNCSERNVSGPGDRGTGCDVPPCDPVSGAVSCLARLYRDCRGNVLILTAAVVPVLLFLLLGATTFMLALAQKQELRSVAEAACNRAVKPLRSVILEDDDRRLRGEQAFDRLATDRKFKVTARTVTAGWLDARVEASATVPLLHGYVGQTALPISTNVTCRGIPPYPALNDVVMSSNFRSPSGTAVYLPYPNAYGRWGLFNPRAIGWDGGAGNAVELQDWTNGFYLNDGVKSLLPPGVTNGYVVELDSGVASTDAQITGGHEGGLLYTAQPSNCEMPNRINTNSSMYKVMELHPGTYRFSLWFRARVKQPDPRGADTNKIVVSLEGVRPVSARVEKLVIDNQDDLTWSYHSFDIPVDSYGIYRFHVAAAGCGDTVGGLFNDLKLTYIQRPSPEYSDPLPPPFTPTS